MSGFFHHNIDRNKKLVPGELNAILGKGTEFSGLLKFEGLVRIDGIFTGDITDSEHLQIGETAKVNAKIRCKTILIQGNLTGEIEALERVTLLNPGCFKGNIRTPSIVVEDGAIFDGICSMTQNGTGNQDLSMKTIS